ncbi:MAG TPA: hypothetical protein VFV78_02435 [Vicinamibacterales bacterium]|nr:hypothetical protein [Vicinamibacterales bacterium]
MPNPDLSNVKALIADDRADVRRLLTEQLRAMGVDQIDTVGAAAGATNLIALIAAAGPAGATPRTQPLPAAVQKFSHDVASPLMCVLALSGLLVREGRADAQTTEDLKRIQAAAEEIALMVRTLGEHVPGRKRGRPARSS